VKNLLKTIDLRQSHRGLAKNMILLKMQIPLPFLVLLIILYLQLLINLKKDFREEKIPEGLEKVFIDLF